MFSWILKPMDPPFVPTPAPALNSPVGFSSTFKSIIFKSLAEPWETLEATVENKFLDLIFDIDLSRLNFVKGSPSSNSSSDLITFSFVTLFPIIFILSTETFSPS